MNIKISIKWEWIELMKELECGEFKAVLLAILDFKKSGNECCDVEGYARAVWEIILKQMKNGRTYAKNGLCGGNPKLKKTAKGKKKTNIDPEMFEKFWEEYPKKVAKQYAKQCFEKLKPTKELLDTMLEAIKKQRTSKQWEEENGKFIPNPATWLKQGRWTDELEVVKASKFARLKIGTTY